MRDIVIKLDVHSTMTPNSDTVEVIIYNELDMSQLIYSICLA